MSPCFGSLVPLIPSQTLALAGCAVPKPRPTAVPTSPVVATPASFASLRHFRLSSSLMKSRLCTSVCCVFFAVLKTVGLARCLMVARTPSVSAEVVVPKIMFYVAALTLVWHSHRQPRPSLMAGVAHLVAEILPCIARSRRALLPMALVICLGRGVSSRPQHSFVP